MQDKLTADDIEQIPLTSQARIKELKSLPTDQKRAFIPPVGAQFRLGPYVFEVAVQNAMQLRFTAKLKDVIIQGVKGQDEGAIIR